MNRFFRVLFDTPDDGGGGEPAPEPQSVSEVQRPPELNEQPTEPRLDEQPAPEAPSASEEPSEQPEDPFQPFGGKENVEAAITLAQGFTTEDGLKAIFAETAQALGISPDQAGALLTGQAPQQPAQQPSGDEEQQQELSDDDVLTWGEARERFEQMLKERVGPIEEQAQQQQATARQAAAAQATQSTLQELNLDPTDEDQQGFIEQVKIAASAHLAADDWNPEHIKNALRKGYEEHTAYLERQARKYLESKANDADSVPQTLGGGSGGGEPVEEPQNIQEAIARARKAGLAG